MVREFKLPDVGEGLTEAEIVSWLVEVGDPVSEDQPVAEVETDKAVVEVPSPVDGTVREIRAKEGEMVAVGDVIITFDVAGEAEAADETTADAADETDGAEGTAQAGDSETGEAEGAVASAVSEVDAGDGEAASAASPGGRTFAAPSARRLARELGVDIDAVEGSGPGGRVTERDVRAAADAEADDGGAEGAATAAEESGAEGVAGPPDRDVQSATRRVGDDAGTAGVGRESGDGAAASAAVESADRDRTLAAPATRRLAEEEGVDLNAVPTDQERDGEAFVTPEQVKAYAEAQRAAQAADAEALAAEGGADAASGAEATGAGGTAEAGEPERREERIPYKGVRRTIGKAMERSKYTAPHVSHHDDADVTRLVEVREELEPVAEERGVRLTYMPFVLKAVAAALQQHPALNAQLDEENEEIVRKHYYNIGVATATDAGLMVPVVKDVDRKDMLTVASEMNELVSKARDRSIAREEMQGGTFSVTNFGAIGGEYATPIINYPEVAILGLGAIDERPKVVDGEVVPRTTLPVSMSVDHRVVDGADAAGFTNTLIRYLEQPERLLLE